jgi:hypothetical protein
VWKKDVLRLQAGHTPPDHAITFVQYDEVLELPQKVRGIFMLER